MHIPVAQMGFEYRYHYLMHAALLSPPGLICDRGLTLGDLIGVLNQFFSRLGLPTLRFKPAYNPYTEPSMEIFSYSEQLKKWMEVRTPFQTLIYVLLYSCC